MFLKHRRTVERSMRHGTQRLLPLLACAFSFMLDTVHFHNLLKQILDVSLLEEDIPLQVQLVYA